MLERLQIKNNKHTAESNRVAALGGDFLAWVYLFGRNIEDIERRRALGKIVLCKKIEIVRKLLFFS